MSTPNGTRIFTSKGDDVTEAVQALYDLAIHSMDFGSNMWSAEDAKPVAELARLCDFEGREEIDKYLTDLAFWAEARDWRSEHDELVYPKVSRRPAHIDWDAQQRALKGHEHVLASTGRCMWPNCGEGA